jgi:hypothetical protein
MKKFILTAVATGALAFGGAASAQDVGSAILNLFGLGQPTYNYGYGYGAPSVAQGQVYRDTYGRTFYYDQYGRQVYLNNYSAPQTIMGYDQWGRPVYNGGQTYSYGGNYPYGAYSYGGNYSSRSWDYDGDGVDNSRDRWPNDPRYW